MLLEKKEDLPEFSSNSSRHLLVIPKISKNAQNWKFLSSAKIIFLNSRAGRSSNFPRQCFSAARWRIYQVQCPPPPLECAGYNSSWQLWGRHVHCRVVTENWRGAQLCLKKLLVKNLTAVGR